MAQKKLPWGNCGWVWIQGRTDIRSFRDHLYILVQLKVAALEARLFELEFT